MKIKGKFIETKELPATMAREMYHIPDRYFGNVSWKTFKEELYAKDYVILIESVEEERIVGFSTQMLFTAFLGEEEVSVIYSGDTIIDQKYWGTRELPLQFWNLSRAVAKTNGGKRIFWMLISKGIRTYRFLPVFFRCFYPTYREPVPDKYQAFMDFIGAYVFPDRYDKNTGLVKSSGKHQYLKAQFHPPVEKTNNPHNAYFYKRNPNYKQGDELLCITEMKIENIQPPLQKYFSEY